MIRIQPPFGVKLIRVLSPQDLGLVDGNNGDADDSALGDKDAVDKLAGGGADRVSEWERIVNMDLKMEDEKVFNREFKTQLLTSLSSWGTLG